MIASRWFSILILFGSALSFAQDAAPVPLGPGPSWRGPVRPTGANEVFATGNGCAMCHSAAPRATAMRSANGDDISPHALWRSTMMATSFRDPYWRAQVARETAAAPERAAEIEALCVRCHAPMAHHSASLAGLPSPRIAAIEHDELAKDGVSCTVCHQIRPEGLGTEATFSGKPKIEKGRVIFGPYPEPAGNPMRMHSGFTPTEGLHIKSSAHCASCHTLTTHHAGKPFPEQSPYLEWRNSEFSNEDGITPTSKSCQECHMPRQGSTRIARNPPGRDFNIAVRPDYAAHTFVGGNAFMLDLMNKNRDELGIDAPEAAMERTIQAARRQLSHDTATLEVRGVEHAEDRLSFDVHVRNLTGHKFPTGYPARRAVMRIEVRAGNRVLFVNGAIGDDGRIIGVKDERNLPHVDVVDSIDDVQVYECVPMDGDGVATTQLTAMAAMKKDNRILPRGWKPDGPYAESTAPQGTKDDPDFIAGSDLVHVRLADTAMTEATTIVVWLEYQPVPPAWVEPLRSVDADEARRFVRMYDGADKDPDVVAVTVATLAR